MQIIYFTLLLLLLGGSLNAQSAGDTTLLTLDEAVRQALANNHDIKIQQQSLSLAQNNVTKANAGQMPRIDAVGSASYTNNFSALDLRTFQPDPPEIDISEAGVETATVSLGLEASQVLWDGGSSRYRYQLLEGQSALERARQEVIINGIVTGVSDLFFEILKLQNQEALVLENIAVTRERIRKLKDRAEFGKTNKLAVLQAETNLNQDLTSLDQLRLIRSNLLVDLKTLINDKTEGRYELISIEPELTVPVAEAIRQSILANNPQLQLANKGVALSEIEVLLNKANTKPVIASFVNAGYFGQRNDVQQLAKIQTLGGTIGLSARYTLFDGGINKTRIQNAQLSRELEVMKKQQLEDQLLQQSEKELAMLRNILQQLDREVQNLQTYQDNYDKVNERYLLGKLPAITLREAQLALSNSKLNTANLKVEYLQTRLRLDQITGNLVR
ncbi:MAG: TolC family protein [Bacteroidota bacterium]